VGLIGMRETRPRTKEKKKKLRPRKTRRWGKIKKRSLGGKPVAVCDGRKKVKSTDATGNRRKPPEHGEPGTDGERAENPPYEKREKRSIMGRRNHKVGPKEGHFRGTANRYSKVWGGQWRHIQRSKVGGAAECRGGEKTVGNVDLMENGRI